MSYRCDYCQTVLFDHSDPFASRCIALNGLTIVERGTVAPYVKRMQKRVCVWHKNADQAISPHNSCHLGDTQFRLLVVLDTSPDSARSRTIHRGTEVAAHRLG